MGLRAGFHYHMPARQDAGGDIWMGGFLGRFIDTLAQFCDQVVCFMHRPRPDEHPLLDYRLRSPNVSLLDIGLHVSVPRRMLHVRSMVRPLKMHRCELDVLLIRGPSPLLPAMARAAGNVPVALHLVGDYLAGIDHLPQPMWRREAIRLWAAWNFRQQLSTAQNSLTFVISSKLYQQYASKVPDLTEVPTATLYEEEFFEREDTCAEPPYRLLFTGRIDPFKGLFEIVEAVHLLVQRGENVVLDVVGWPERGSNTLEKLQAFVQQCGIADRVRFVGFKGFGPDLFAHYKEADVYLLASKGDEGGPRVLWEAMGFSLPAVVSRVSGGPTLLQDRLTAMLVEPGSGPAIADAVGEIINDAELRRTLIRRGSALARSFTLESVVGDMVAQTENWLTTQAKRHR